MDAWIHNRRARTVLALAALVAALAVPALAAGAARVFKKGSHGPRVVVIQRALGLHQDGVFGPATSRAVKRFQRRHGLVADGVVGPATWTLIRRARAHQQRASSPRVSSRGALVVRLQRRLGIAADGVFGPGTKAAVKAFQ